MIIPESALPWVQLHRTGASGDVATAYTEVVVRDYDEFIKGPWLPESCKDILDIGCGMAGIDVLLYRHYDKPRLVLLDGDGQVENHEDKINFHPEGMKPFNDMAAMKELLSANAVDLEQVFTLPIGYEGASSRIDLCISLLSWGWHYPVNTYLDLVCRCMRPGGRLILDLRAGQGGERDLADAGFELIGVIRGGPKGSRLCYRFKAELESSIFS